MGHMPYLPTHPDCRPTRAEAEYDEFVCKPIKPHPRDAAMISELYTEIYGDDALNSGEVPF